MESARPKIAFIFVTILLDAIGMGLLIPILPDVLRPFISDPAELSRYFGYFIGLYALMQFIASPILGSLSDRYGRRPVLLVSLLGAGVDYVFMAFAPTLAFLFAGRFVSGLTGASHAVATSYMADISTDKDRAANFGMIGAAWGVGFILGPMLGGLMSAFGPKAPFLAAAALNLVNFLFGLFVLPESLPPERRAQGATGRANPLASILKVLAPSPYVALVWIFFLMFLAGQVHPVNWTLYTQTRFGWSSAQVGFSLSLVGVIFALSQAVVPRYLVPRLGEKGALTFGLTAYIFVYAGFGLLTQGWMMYVVILFLAAPGVAMPALQSILAKHVPSHEQGSLQGNLMALGSLSSILAPLIFANLFAYFTAPGAPVYFPGVAYLAAALISVVALGAWLVKKES